jgi:hypothetical protein
MTIGSSNLEIRYQLQASRLNLYVSCSPTCCRHVPNHPHPQMGDRPPLRQKENTHPKLPSVLREFHIVFDTLFIVCYII